MSWSARASKDPTTGPPFLGEASHFEDAAMTHLARLMIIEERCDCGHAQSAHGALVLRTSGVEVQLEHKGVCTTPGCFCPRYRWWKSVLVPARGSTAAAAKPAES
jgi:hypothetical protein